MNVYFKRLKSGFLLGKTQAIPFLLLPLNCKPTLWSSDCGQLDFITVPTGSPVMSSCSLQVSSSIMWLKP